MPVSPELVARDILELLSSVSGTGSEVSLRRLLQDGIVKGYISHQFLESGIFPLKLFQPSGLLYPHAAVLFAPAVLGLLSDAHLPAGLTYGVTLTQEHLRLPELPNNLLGRKCPSAHRNAPSQTNSKSNILLGSVFGGAGHPLTRYSNTLATSLYGETWPSSTQMPFERSENGWMSSNTELAAKKSLKLSVVVLQEVH